MRRRAFIAALGGAAALARLPIARAQAPRSRRVAVLMGLREDNSDSPLAIAAFRRGLQQLGWAEGRDLDIDIRWGNGDSARIRSYAEDLARLKPEVVLAVSPPVVSALRDAAPQIPVVFALVPDPVRSGFVASAAHPGGNVTGFTSIQGSIGSKWLQLAREIAPAMLRALVVWSPDVGNYAPYADALQSGAASLGITLVKAPVRTVSEVDSAIESFQRDRAGTLVVIPDNFTIGNAQAITDMAMQRHMPGIYPYEVFARSGGLISYGVDRFDVFSRAAGYVDRILKGAKPSELPVQDPEKFILIVNMKTAKTLGVTVPQSLLVAADEVIE